MGDFNKTLQEAAMAVLKRELAEDERVEFLDLAGTLGVSNVEDYLYILMVFKRHEDRLNEKFEDMTVLSKRIDETLTGSVERILGEGAKRIGTDMSETIASGARDTLVQISEFYSLRGQIILACFMTVACCISYWLGSANVFNPEVLPRSALTFLILGWGIFFFGFVHTGLWACDNWKQIKRKPFYKTFFGLQIFFVVVSYLAML